MKGLLIFACLLFLSGNCIKAQLVLDNTFGNSGVIISTLPNSSEIEKIELQSDGKTLAAGGVTLDAKNQIQLLRFTDNGQLDPQFGENGVVRTSMDGGCYPNTLTIQPDGRVLVAGWFKEIGQVRTHSLLVRYNSDGSIDGTFGQDGLVKIVATDSLGSDAITGICLAKNGYIVASGYTDGKFILFRFTSEGIPDTGFGDGGKVLIPFGLASNINSVVVDEDGKIYVAGSSSHGAGGNETFYLAVAKYDETGGLDTSFGFAGIKETPVATWELGNLKILHVRNMFLDSEGLVVGASGEKSAILIKLNRTGSYIQDFGDAGVVKNDQLDRFTALAKQSNGNLLAQGLSGIITGRHLDCCNLPGTGC